MIQMRILFIVFLSLVFLQSNLTGQKVSAILEPVKCNKDSLTIAVTLKNETDKAVFIVCGVDVLSFKDFVPVRINFGSFEEEVNTRNREGIEEKEGNIQDTITFVLPLTEERYQKNFAGEKLDVFEIFSNMEQEYYEKNIDCISILTPPDEETLIQQQYLDIDFYHIVKKQNNRDKECLFCSQIVILKPHQEKRFEIDLSYLLLRKATYQFIFNYKSDNKLFYKDTEFLKKSGFSRFKGRITSNTIYIRVN
jgi:hypothetical protein